MYSYELFTLLIVLIFRADVVNMSLFSCSEADAQGANSPRTATIKGESSALQEKCEEEKIQMLFP